MFKVSYNCTHLTYQQGCAQNPSCQVSAVCEPRTSRCTSQVQKRQRNQRSNCLHLLDHGESKRIPEKKPTSASLTMIKLLNVCITTNCGKFLEMGGADRLTCLLRRLYEGQEAIVRTRHGPMDWFKVGKGVSRLYIITLLI